jgi:uncharacterized protein YecE (DUF72 family)
VSSIRVGIGGWSFAPWRGGFYPPGLPHAQELAFAASRLTSIEINATFHGPQKPASFRNWRDAVPEDFAFAVKAPRTATWRRELAEAGPTIARFLDGGVMELGQQLGPMLWQFPPTRRFEPAAMEAFLELLPPEHGGRPLRHAVEVFHESFADPGFATLLRRFGVAWAVVDADGYGPADSETADFVYARLKRNAASEAEGYAGAALDRWAAQLRTWARGARACFAYFIGGDKVRAPDAAQAMLARLARPS